MSLSSVVVPGLFEDHISSFAQAGAEIRVVLQNKDDGLPYANQSSLEYWVINESSPSTVAIYGTGGTTNASGQLILDVSGTLSVGTNVLVAVKRAEGGAGSSDDIFGFGSDQVTAF